MRLENLNKLGNQENTHMMSSKHNEENDYEHDLDMLILSHHTSVSYHVCP